MLYLSGSGEARIARMHCVCSAPSGLPASYRLAGRQVRRLVGPRTASRVALYQYYGATQGCASAWRAFDLVVPVRAHFFFLSCVGGDLVVVFGLLCGWQGKQVALKGVRMAIRRLPAFGAGHGMHVCLMPGLEVGRPSATGHWASQSLLQKKICKFVPGARGSGRVPLDAVVLVYRTRRIRITFHMLGGFQLLVQGSMFTRSSLRTVNK